MLRNGEANSARRYPAESNHHHPLDALRAPELHFLDPPSVLIEKRF